MLCPGNVWYVSRPGNWAFVSSSQSQNRLRERVLLSELQDPEPAQTPNRFAEVVRKPKHRPAPAVPAVSVPQVESPAIVQAGPWSSVLSVCILRSERPHPYRFLGEVVQLTAPAVRSEEHTS